VNATDAIVLDLTEWECRAALLNLAYAHVA
jgi:hypothetical protein